MKNIKTVAASFFAISVSILSIISVMGVWDVFGEDVIWKSFKTLGLLAFAAVIVLAAGDHIGLKAIPDSNELPNPLWGQIRKLTLSILIVAISLLALLGILSIWEIIKDKDVLWKSVSSLIILAFGALIIVATCRQMEGTNKSKPATSTTFVVKKDEAGVESVSKQS